MIVIRTALEAVLMVPVVVKGNDRLHSEMAKKKYIFLCHFARLHYFKYNRLHSGMKNKIPFYFVIPLVCTIFAVDKSNCNDLYY